MREEQLRSYKSRVGEYGVRRVLCGWAVDHIPSTEQMSVEPTEAKAMEFARGMERLEQERFAGQIRALLAFGAAVVLLVWMAVRFSSTLWGIP